MKKICYLLLLVILFGTIKVNAAGCIDYLDCITTTDTTLSTESPTVYTVKKGTEFKMCYQAGAESVYILSDGRRGSYISRETYKLREPFDMKKAHRMNDSFTVYAGNEIYNDPAESKIIGTISKNMEVKGTYYYGPFVYVPGEINGWVYTEFFSEHSFVETNNTSNTEENNEVTEPVEEIDEDLGEEFDDVVSETDTDDEEESSKDKYMVIAVPISVVVLIIALFVIIKNNKKRQDIDIMKSN